MEAYASVIDCCQSYSLDYLSEHYVKKANKKLVQWLTIRCYDLVTDRTSEMNLDNTSNNLHLLRSTMNFKLCHGDIVVASQKGNNGMYYCSNMSSIICFCTGKAALSIVGRHNVSLLLTTTIENLSVELLMLK